MRTGRTIRWCSSTIVSCSGGSKKVVQWFKNDPKKSPGGFEKSPGGFFEKTKSPGGLVPRRL